MNTPRFVRRLQAGYQPTATRHAAAAQRTAALAIRRGALLDLLAPETAPNTEGRPAAAKKAGSQRVG